MIESPRYYAQLQGRNKYKSEPCPTCGTTERFASNAVCVECNRTKARERARRKREEKKHDNRN